MCLVAGIFSVPGFCRVYLYREVYHQESLQWQGLGCVWDHVYVCFLDAWVGQGSQGHTCLVSSVPRVRVMFSPESLTVTPQWVNLGHKAFLISIRSIMTCKYGYVASMSQTRNLLDSLASSTALDSVWEFPWWSELTSSARLCCLQGGPPARDQASMLRWQAVGLYLHVLTVHQGSHILHPLALAHSLRWGLGA